MFGYTSAKKFPITGQELINADRPQPFMETNGWVSVYVCVWGGLASTSQPKAPSLISTSVFIHRPFILQLQSLHRNRRCGAGKHIFNHFISAQLCSYAKWWIPCYLWTGSHINCTSDQLSLIYLYIWDLRSNFKYCIMITIYFFEKWSSTTVTLTGQIWHTKKYPPVSKCGHICPGQDEDSDKISHSWREFCIPFLRSKMASNRSSVWISEDFSFRSFWSSSGT